MKPKMRTQNTQRRQTLAQKLMHAKLSFQTTQKPSLQNPKQAKLNQRKVPQNFAETVS